MNHIENLEAQSLSILAVAADGGTQYVEVKVNEESLNLYIDGRIGSRTVGEVFYDSPKEKSSRMIPGDSPLAQSIKKLNTEPGASAPRR